MYLSPYSFLCRFTHSLPNINPRSPTTLYLGLRRDYQLEIQKLPFFWAVVGVFDLMHIVSLRAFYTQISYDDRTRLFPPQMSKGRIQTIIRRSFHLLCQSPLPLSTKLILVSAAVNDVSQRRFPITTDRKRVHACLHRKSETTIRQRERMYDSDRFCKLQHGRRQSVSYVNWIR